MPAPGDARGRSPGAVSESGGGRPGRPTLIIIIVLVSVDVKQHLRRNVRGLCWVEGKKSSTYIVKLL